MLEYTWNFTCITLCMWHTFKFHPTSPLLKLQFEAQNQEVFLIVHSAFVSAEMLSFASTRM